MDTVIYLLNRRVDAGDVDNEFEHNMLTQSFTILMKFICHNIEHTAHLITSTFAKAGLLFHLAGDLKIDLGTFIYNQICGFAIKLEH